MNTQAPSPRSRVYLPGDYLVDYDPNNESHQQGFSRLLTDQQASQGITDARARTTHEARAEAASNSIGRQFQVTLLHAEINHRPLTISGMTATTRADAAEGPIARLENIFVTPDARRQGYAKQLMNAIFIDAWNGGFSGLAWETGRKNEPARRLYTHIDPTFNTDHLHDVWRILPKQIPSIAKPPGPHAHLSTLSAPPSVAQTDEYRDLNHISATLQNQPEKDLNHLAGILSHQGTNGLNASSFVVSSRKGGFAIASVGYSTFDVSTRSDVRLYLPNSLDAEGTLGLMRVVSHELVRRQWRGPMQIEFANSVFNADGVPLNGKALKIEKDKVEKAQNALRTLGAEPLMHNDDRMVPYSLVGKRYVAAVIEATKNLPSRPLSAVSQTRLANAARNYGLDYGNGS